jgi:hypothetical protein
VSALAQAALPTARTIRWWPLAAVVLPVAGLVSIARSEDRPASTVLLLGAAALASVVVSALRDDAAATLMAVPVSLARRRALRLALMGTPVLLAWESLRVLGDTDRPGTASLLALVACAVAVATWGPVRWSLLAAAAVPVLWYAGDRMAGGQGAAGDVLGWWRTDPWPVLAVAVLACVLGSRR